MKAWKKWIVGVAVLGLTAASLGGGLPSVFADEPAAGAEAAKVVIGDKSTPRVLTIHKYNNLSKAMTDSQITEDNGKQTTLYPNADYQPVGGVTFTAQQYVPKDGVAPADVKDIKINDDGSIDAGTWVIKGSPLEQTTTEDGVAKFDLGAGTDADGVYVVTEKKITDTSQITIGGVKDDGSAQVIAQVKPFLVYVPMTDRETKDTIMYNIDINPKNEIINFKVDKYINAIGQKNYSVQAGKTFKWILTSKVPTFSADQIDTQQMSPQIQYYMGEDKNLTLVPDSWTITFYPTETDMKNDTNGVAGKTVDRTMTDIDFEDAEESDHNPNNSTTTTDRKVAAMMMDAEDISKNLVAPNKNIFVKITVDAKTSEDFSGMIANDVQGTLAYKTNPKITDDQAITVVNVSNIPTITPVIGDKSTPIYGGPTWEQLKTPTDVDSNDDSPQTVTPDYYTGGFEIKKVKAENGESMGAGVEFKLALTKQDALDGKFIKNADGTADLVATTADNGVAAFDGLALDWQTAIDPDGTKNNVTKLEDLKKEYWIVETKSVEGYELLKSPVEFTVTFKTNGNDPDITIANYKNGELPKTGGNGKLWVVALAIAFMAGSLILVVYRKRQETVA